MDTHFAPSPLLNELEASNHPRCSVDFLRRRRVLHKDPITAHIGRLVRYPITGPDVFAAANIFGAVHV